mgnify:FL=1
MFDEKEAPGLGFPFAKAICLADVRRYHFADVRQVLSVTCTRGNLNQLYMSSCALYFTFVRMKVLNIPLRVN